MTVKLLIDKWGKANLVCLSLAICIVLFLPVKKTVWYDETISILISKGITYNTADNFNTADSVSSLDINYRLNNVGHVLDATLHDNGNSVAYNVGLYFFSKSFGNSVGTYIFFSRLIAAICLICFFILCTQFLGNSLFSGLAVLLLLFDPVFWGMSHEIRAYILGILFIILSGIYFYKYYFISDKPLFLFLTVLFSILAILCHYLSVYVMLVYAFYIFIGKWKTLLDWKKIAAIIVPGILLVGYFIYSYAGFKQMSAQNAAILSRKLKLGFSTLKAFMLMLKFTVNNFKIVFSSYHDNNWIIIFSFLLLIALFIVARAKAQYDAERKRITFLGVCGFSGSIFLFVLSIKAHHYTSLYFRYFSFVVPFTAIFMAYVFKILFSCYGSKKLAVWCIALIIIIPNLFLFIKANTGISQAQIKYSHIETAQKILNEKITCIDVPDWDDALLINSFLPQNYKLTYKLKPLQPYFILHTTGGDEKIIKIKIDS